MKKIILSFAFLMTVFSNAAFAGKISVYDRLLCLDDENEPVAILLLKDNSAKNLLGVIYNASSVDQFVKGGAVSSVRGAVYQSPYIEDILDVRFANGTVVNYQECLRMDDMPLARFQVWKEMLLSQSQL